MKLIDLFQMGGAFYMFTITALCIVMLVFTVKTATSFFIQKNYTKQGLGLILLFGSLAMVVGFLAQAVGLFQAFAAIEQAGDISPSLMAAGFRISMITPLYGTIVFIFSLFAWGLLREVYIRNKND